jgi:uncharacterized membrane protein
MTAIMIVCRVLHIAATCTSLGGLFYARFVLWPTLPQLPASEREAFLHSVIRRYAVIKWTGVTVVALTGVVQWIVLWPLVTNGALYLLYFAIKMAGAVGLFSITALLALPARRLERMHANRGAWSALNVACGLTILIGAALMRTVAKTIPPP